MQNSIQEMIQKNKFTYDQLYAKEFELNTNMESDFKSIVNIGNSLPGTLSQKEKGDVDEIISQIEIRLKFYETQIRSISNDISAMEQASEVFLAGLGQVKGNLLLNKNSLIQTSVDQVRLLKEGLGSNEMILRNIMSVVKDLKSVCGVDDSMKMNSMVQEAVRREMGMIRSNDENSNMDLNIEVLADNILKIQKQVDEMGVGLHEIRMYFDKTVDSIERDLKRLSSIIDDCKGDSNCYKTKLNENHERLLDEVNDLRVELSGKMKIVEKVINNNTVRRYV